MAELRGDGAERWLDAERVWRWIRRTETEEPDRRERFLIMTGLIPFSTDAAIRILEIGCGYGSLATVVLEVFPRAQLTGLDISPIMLTEAWHRLAPFSDRVRLKQWDQADRHLPSGVEGPFEAVLSSQTIHFLSADEQKGLFRRVRSWLAPGGCFLNLDVLRAATTVEFERWNRAEAMLARERIAAGHHGQPPQPDHVATLGELIQWTEGAGFQDVACYWQRLDRALVGAFLSTVNGEAR